MKMRTKLISVLFFSLVLSLECKIDEDYFESFIHNLYANYPDFIPRLLSYNGTNFGSNFLISSHNVYRGYTMETKYQDGYSIYLANAYRESLNNGIFESSKLTQNVLYKCNTAIRFCSGNPAYCKYHEGDKGTNIIIVSGHAGPLRPVTIPDRTEGCWIPETKTCVFKHDCEDKKRGIWKDTKRCNTKDYDDLSTQDMALKLADNLQSLTGKQPHVIVNRLHRMKLDVNRKMAKGTYYVKEAVQAWSDFHDFIETAKQNLVGNWGIILDIHGNNKPENWTMLGYGVSREKVDMGLFTASDTCLRGLASNVPFKDLFFGNNSLGYFMEGENIRAIPSPQHKFPKGRNYFPGDYIVKHHGSLRGGKVDAVQIEMPANNRDEDSQNTYLSAVARAVVKFIDANYYKKGRKNKLVDENN